MGESKENNKSLMNLKECVKAKARMAQEDGFVHIPWRSNKLTMLLKVRMLLYFTKYQALNGTCMTADIQRRIAPTIEDD